jgi:hypothetical protein
VNQAAQTAKRSPEFAANYQVIANRRGKKIATIAIARKLLTRAWHLLSDLEVADANEPLRRPEDGRVAKPRVSSPLRHEPAPAPRSIT